MHVNKLIFLNQQVNNFWHFDKDRFRNLEELNMQLGIDKFEVHATLMELIEVLKKKILQKKMNSISHTC